MYADIIRTMAFSVTQQLCHIRSVRSTLIVSPNIFQYCDD